MFTDIYTCYWATVQVYSLFSSTFKAYLKTLLHNNVIIKGNEITVLCSFDLSWFLISFLVCTLLYVVKLCKTLKTDAKYMRMTCLTPHICVATLLKDVSGLKVWKSCTHPFVHHTCDLRDLFLVFQVFLHHFRCLLLSLAWLLLCLHHTLHFSNWLHGYPTASTGSFSCVCWDFLPSRGTGKIIYV